MEPNPWLVIGPIGVGMLVALIGGFWMSLRKSGKKALDLEIAARNDKRRENTVLRDDNPSEIERWRVGDGEGQYVAIDTGSGGTGVGQQEAIETTRGAADHLYLSRLALEGERNSRDRYLATLLTTPGWSNKLTLAKFPLLRSGGGGRTVTEMRRIREYWEERDLRPTVRQWLDRTAQAGYPSMGEANVSDGGMAITLAVAIEEFKKKYSQVPVYLTLLCGDDKNRRKNNIPEILDLFFGLVDGIRLLDNERFPSLTDQGIAQHTPALKTAPWINHRTETAYNIWADIHRHHKFSTVRVAYRTVTVKKRDAFRKLPPFYYTPTDPLEIAMLNCVDEVVDDLTTQSYPHEPAAGPTYVHVIGAFEPDPSLIRIAESVEASVLRARGQSIKLGFASIGKPLTNTTEIAVTVVSFFPLDANLQQVKDYLTGKTPIDPKFVLKPTVLTPIGGNHDRHTEPIPAMEPA